MTTVPEVQAVLEACSTYIGVASNMIAEGGPMVEPLRDLALFNRVFLSFGMPTWPNGFDVAPGWLRHEIEATGALERDAAA